MLQLNSSTNLFLKSMLALPFRFPSEICASKCPLHDIKWAKLLSQIKAAMRVCVCECWLQSREESNEQIKIFFARWNKRTLQVAGGEKSCPAQNQKKMEKEASLKIAVPTRLCLT